MFQTLLKLCVNCGILTNSTMAPQCGNSFSTVVPHKKIMEETAKCGITVEYRRIYLNCGKTACLFSNLDLIPQLFHSFVIT